MLRKYVQLGRLLITGSVFLLLSCSRSDQEIYIYELCVESAQLLDLYAEGEHITKTSFGKMAIIKTCSVKANLYSRGYRIQKHINSQDIQLYYDHLSSDRSLESLYMRAIKDGVDI